MKTGTVQRAVTETGDGVIGYVHIKPTGSVRRQLCVYLNFIDETAAQCSGLVRFNSSNNRLYAQQPCWREVG